MLSPLSRRSPRLLDIFSCFSIIVISLYGIIQSATPLRRYVVAHIAGGISHVLGFAFELFGGFSLVGGGGCKCSKCSCKC